MAGRAIEASRQSVVFGKKTNAGLLVIGDVVDFSRMRGAAQRRVMQALWEFLNASPFICDKNPPLMNGTGDGVLIACPDGKRGYAQILEFSCAWIRAVRKAKADLRVGLHQGRFDEMEVQRLGKRKEVVGQGPNECARIVSIGDGGSIVCSEEFVRGWLAEDDDQVLQNFYPSEQRPLQVYVKHDVPQAIRLYRKAPNRKLPARVTDLDATETRLRSILEEIRAQFSALVEGSKGKGRGRVTPRVSLFAKRDGELRLTSYVMPRGATVVDDSAQLRLSIEGEGEAPMGRAFMSGDVQILRDLPDPDLDMPAYQQELRTTGGFSAGAIECLPQLSRAFVCMPLGFPRFGLGRPSLLPDVVLCIETTDPLASVSGALLEEAAELIFEGYGELIPLVWRRRLS